MRISYTNPFFWFLLTLPGSALFADVTIKATPYPNACMDVRLPRWKDPEVPPYSWLKWQDCDYEFRATDGGVLVGLYCGKWPKETRVDSLERYAVSFSTRKVRRATPSEWEQADPYLLTRITADPEHSRLSQLMAGQKVKYQGKEFGKTGAKWAYFDDPSLVSQNGTFLAVDSWDGRIETGEGFVVFIWQVHLNGHYYVDLYSVVTGQRLLTLKGEFHGVDPHDLFHMAAWVSPHYYLLPLDARNLRRFALCDLRRVPATTDRH